MGKVKINKEDKNRVLLTELLPYEVPIIFSNEGFYTLVTKNQHESLLKRIKELSGISSNEFYGIPFNYEIGKGFGGDTRTLSVMHPCCQLNFVELYEKYSSLMLHLCSRSHISLRRISKVASFFYDPNFVFENEDSLKNNEVEVEPEINDESTKYLKSYFTYKPIDLIYKFYEKMEFRRLEQRFNFMMTFDISKCFYHVYTHSITWAIKDKASSKRNARAESFENRFDKIMQQANYNETNGIIVGPEVSRIFAEIILQRIDIDVTSELPFKYGIDYEIRRYVDDYFVFANDENYLQKIKSTYQEKLSFYKLYLNHGKSEIVSSPFISNIHVAKREINQLLENFKKSITKENKNEKNEVLKSFEIRKPYSVSQNFIKDFQCVAKRNNLTYDIISKDVVRYLKTFLTNTLKNKNTDKTKDFENFLLAFFDILFYSYSLYINANTTFKVAQIIVLTTKYFETFKNNSIKHSIYSKITQDIDSIFSINQRKTRNKSNIEILNILIALKKLGDSYLLTEKRLISLFEIDNTKDYLKLNYFQIVTLLYYIENKSNYLIIKENIEKSLIEKYSTEEDIFTKSEFVIQFFDVICCPFISEKTKRLIINQTKFCTKDEKVEHKINEISQNKTWFIDWDTEIDLEKILKKKEWTSSY